MSTFKGNEIDGGEMDLTSEPLSHKWGIYLIFSSR